MELHKKFRIIFDIVNAKEKLKTNLTDQEKEYYTKLTKVDTIIVTGGRNSFKSYSMAMILVILTIVNNFKILLTRYTLNSAEDSIIPEITEKIDLLNFNKFVKIYKKRIIKTDKNIRDEDDAENLPRIVFKGIKTSAGNQTASLKSLKGFNCFVLDEAEEHPDYKDWKKIYRSIRNLDLPNLSILILNPTPKEHWIYKEFFKKKGLTGGANTVIDNVCYIHMIYTDMLQYVPDNILAEFERTKKNDPKDYKESILGGFKDAPEGVLFDITKLQRFKMSDLNIQNVSAKIGIIDVADSGTDYFSFPILYKIADKYYLTDVIYTSDDFTITKPLTVAKALKHELDYIKVETNSQGKDFYRYLKEQLENTSIHGEFTSSNKETRILMQAEWIINNCLFRDDYETGSDYDKFIADLTRYMKMLKNQRDDAPDSLAAFSMFVKRLFGR